ncbi:MAG: DASH family cryptochrome [Bacteroidota bacterium]
MKNALLWFRNDLRTVDHQGLTEAAKAKKVIAVYCFDPRHYADTPYGFKKTEKFRAKFLIETVRELQQHLAKLNISLLVYHEKPESVLPKITETFSIDTLIFQKEWTQEEVVVQNGLKKGISGEVKMLSYYDQFLFHPSDIPFQSFQEIPQVFTQFRKRCEKMAKVLPALPVPEPKPKENLLHRETPIPSLKELGLEIPETEPRSAFPFLGGETEALNRLEHYFWKTGKLAYYKKTRNGLVGIDYSSKFSPWLANGSISARTIYHEVKRFEREVKKNQDTYWLVFELIWRDYFKYVSLKHGNAIFKIGGILEKNYAWKNDPRHFQAWTEGSTFEPFVNANMIELARTGWMSNRGRQNVASYWAKELEQDWRIGAAYFEAMLIDYDVHSNWGNWMYNSGVGNDPRDRKFNIKRQADMYDSNGRFQKQWLQETLF